MANYVCMYVCMYVARDIHTTYIVDSDGKIFLKLFMAILFYGQNFCEKSVERKSLVFEPLPRVYKANTLF